jgi:DNA-binding transcriptional regulator LsrR (DeoR family)
MSPEGFHAWCVRKGKAGARASAIVRSERSKALAEAAKALYATGKTQQQIATILDLSVRHIIRLLNIF